MSGRKRQGSGLEPRSVQSRSALVAGALWVAWLCLAASPAWAARIVDIRVGQHAGYSRVVFELDAPAGYKVERQAPAKGVDDLLISLDAAAKAQTLKKKLDFIERVDVTPQGGRSTVRIRLKGRSLKLKEMILANPPRIVLDVIDEGAVAASKKPAPRAAATPKPAAKPKVTAQPKAQPKPEPVVEKVEAQKPAPEKADAPMAKPSKAESAKVEDAESRLRAAVQPPASMPDSSPTGTTGTTVKLPPAKIAPANVPPPPAPGSIPAPPPSATSRPAPTPAKPTGVPTRPAAATPPADDGLFSPTNMMLGALGFVLLAGAGFVFVRRRNAAEIIDASEFDNPLGEENPFSGLDSAEADESDEAGIPIADAVPETPAEAKQMMHSPAIANEPVQQGGIAMDLSQETSTTAMSGSQIPPMGPAAGSEDVSRMMSEFERRLASMETRIDELVDTKERLERQVAAQTEELRVQRAAIARTQRAVRNMSRPGDDSPTEPAPRDPARPEGPRS